MKFFTKKWRKCWQDFFERFLRDTSSLKMTVIWLIRRHARSGRLDCADFWNGWRARRRTFPWTKKSAPRNRRCRLPRRFCRWSKKILVLTPNDLKIYNLTLKKFKIDIYHNYDINFNLTPIYIIIENLTPKASIWPQMTSKLIIWPQKSWKLIL